MRSAQKKRAQRSYQEQMKQHRRERDAHQNNEPRVKWAKMMGGENWRRFLFSGWAWAIYSKEHFTYYYMDEVSRADMTQLKAALKATHSHKAKSGMKVML